nr:immunoglobulin heavy chain junction region [Mus musculus]
CARLPITTVVAGEHYW